LPKVQTPPGRKRHNSERDCPSARRGGRRVNPGEWLPRGRQAQESEVMLIGEDVKIARTLLGWPPSQLARELSMTATTIKNFEIGKRRLSALEISVLRRLPEAAGIEFTNGGERGGDATTGEVMVVIKPKTSSNS
jgi:ribosome-binding protein aMBF1 (putative translation factor)